MKNKISNIIVSLSFLGILVFFAVANIIAPDKDISYSERRSLAQMPDTTLEEIFKKNADGSTYFDDLEEYLLDQFLTRDGFRALNVAVRKYLFMQKDINGIYIIGDSIFKMDHRLNEEAVNRSADVYLKVIEKYFSENGANVYYTVVPDKNYYSAKEAGYLSLDYDKLFSIMNGKLSDYTFIDIRSYLSADDYYRTDLHWDQTKITGVANTLLSAMGEAGSVSAESYEKKSYEDFRGAYYGQAALPIKPDTLSYLTGGVLDKCKLFDYETGKYRPMYAEEKLGGVDSYDVFLWGPRSLLTIENPECKTGKELVIFRDSFGSSLAPLMAGEYSKITLVDLRYVSSANLGRFIKFSDNCDVLFMYNAGTLNTVGQGSIS